MNDCLVRTTRPSAVSGPGRNDRSARRYSQTPAAHRACATVRKHRPRSRYRVPNLASQMRIAFASMAWNTGSSSPGELEMTCSTSEVAVCCSSASVRSSVRWRSSSSSRVFSMAMTAWAAKFWTNSICLSVNGRTSCRKMLMAPIKVFSLSIGTATRVRTPPSSRASTATGSPAL